MNKDEAKKCLSLAEKYFAEGSRDKALKFARKSLALDGDLVAAQTLLDKISASPSESQARPEPHKIKKNSSPTEKTLHSQTEEKEREFSAEQAETVKRIKSNAKDYYAVLGVERSASESDLKRAYRKMALDVHPDKNSAPGSSEAFKIIAHAYNVLSDPAKRESYDRFGAESSTSGISSPFSHRHRSHHDFFEQGSNELSPEELFNLFFGGGMGLNANRGFQSATFTFGADGQPRLRRGFARAARPTPNARRPSQESDNSGPDTSLSVYRILQLLLQFLPIIIFILFNFFSSREPTFSFSQTDRYSYKLSTSHRGVQFYVQPSEYSYYFSDNPRYLREFENKVEATYVNHLQDQCQKEMRDRQSRINQLYWWGSQDELEAARNVKLPSCDELQKFYKDR